jgi:CheY-like chemotaxis protein
VEQQAKILVVEDEPMLRSYLIEIFDMEGIPAKGAADGCEAVELLDAIFNGSGTPPRVILLDWLMPCMDGYHVYEKIALDPRLKSTNIILVSAAGEAIKIPDGYPTPPMLHKPYEVPELLAIVRQAAPDLFTSA